MVVEYKYEVLIPMKSFISKWGDGDVEEDTLGWLEEYVGLVNSGTWNADIYFYDAETARFCFKKESDAIAFKLRWS